MNEPAAIFTVACLLALPASGQESTDVLAAHAEAHELPIRHLHG